MTNTQRAIAFLGAVVPQDMCIQSPACSAGTNKDMLRLIRALGEASGSTLTVFSVQPVGVYPTSRKILVRPGRVDLGHGISCQLVPFVNVLFLKQLTILFGALSHLLAWLWRRRDRQCDVLVHNVYPSMSLPVLLTTKLLGSKSVALVTDLPHDLCFDFRGWRGMLQRLNLFVETHALAHFSGIITYTRFIGEDFSPYRPMLVMEGGVDPGDANLAPEAGTADASQSERILLFSGTLSTIKRDRRAYSRHGRRGVRSMLCYLTCRLYARRWMGNYATPPFNWQPIIGKGAGCWKCGSSSRRVMQKAANQRRTKRSGGGVMRSSHRVLSRPST